MEDQDIEGNKIVALLNISYTNVEREISFAVYNNTRRLFSTGTFYDNEHYTAVESLLIQLKESQAIFEIICIIPEIKSEKRKIFEKLSEYPSSKILQGKEAKLRDGNIQSAMTFLLQKELKFYVKEMQNKKAMIVLEKLLEVLSLQQDSCNQGQFKLEIINLHTSMMLDKPSINALQIFSKESQKKLIASNNTLFDIFNKCKTAFGGRCLRRWMKQPLQSRQKLQQRLDRVQFFIANPVIKNLFQTQLKKLPDLDRLYFVFYRVAIGKKNVCDVSDLIKIYKVVESMHDLVDGLEKHCKGEKIVSDICELLSKNVKIISKISMMIEKGIDMSSNKRDNEYFVRSETQPSLDVIMTHMKQIQNEIKSEIRKVSNHLGLQVEKTESNTYKYVLEANKKEAINLVKQTKGYKFLTAKQTRITFTTDTLIKHCERLKLVEAEYQTEQQTVLRKMFQIVAGYYSIMEQLSFVLGEIDVLTTMATIINTADGNWCRPTFTNSVKGVGMHHPCVRNCIPNDIEMSSEKTVILTGPNMGGKSTYIRTIGVAVYLAHIGCYAPAKIFQTPIIDSIITRVGASDLQLRGISTFMSEMIESACMLGTATSNSLVLIDELGRGTSTCEGFGIAWAICQDLHERINPFCLFATHFHEMTRMADQVPQVQNMYTACKVVDGLLKLQYRVERGKMQKSYGIEVMKMLQFPAQVVENAQSYLDYYERCEEEDEEYSKFTQEEKDQIIQKYEQMQFEIRNYSDSNRQNMQKKFESEVQEFINSIRFKSVTASD